MQKSMFNTEAKQPAKPAGDPLPQNVTQCQKRDAERTMKTKIAVNGLQFSMFAESKECPTLF